MRRLPLLTALLVLLLVAPAQAAGAQRTVPRGFLGTMLDGPMLETGAPVTSELNQMVGTGIESIRLAIYWDEVQPRADAPYDFAVADRFIAAAARRKLRVLVTILRVPPWARRDPSREWSPPADPKQFGAFAGAVAARYGTRGTLWRARPALPRMAVRDFQVWNEPAGFQTGAPSIYWNDPEWYPERFVAMLRAAHGAIKAADPRANVVLAGHHGFAWKTIPVILRRGARGLFDKVALHIFTKEPANVIEAIRLTRSAMSRTGTAPVPVLLTEATWPASRGRIGGDHRTRPFETTPAGQSRNLRELMLLLAKHRRALQIDSVYWYSWMSIYRGNDPFSYGGLRRSLESGKVTATPAQRAFRRVARLLEGCAKRRADDC